MGSISFAYQRIYDSDRQSFGCEVLCRWNGGTPLPLIEKAQRDGALVELDLLLLSELSKCFHKLVVAEPGAKYITINLTSQSVEQMHILNVMQSLLLAMQQTAPGIQIIVEITETSLVSDPSSFVKSTSWLRERGFQIFIDDFGSGFCPIGKLLLVSVDGIKLAKDLMSLVPFSESAGMDFGKFVGELKRQFPALHVVVEGIESEVDEVVARMVGGNLFQGYLYHKPSIFS